MLSKNRYSYKIFCTEDDRRFIFILDIYLSRDSGFCVKINSRRVNWVL